MFWQITQKMWATKTWDLDKLFISQSFITFHFLGFFHWMVSNEESNLTHILEWAMIVWKLCSKCLEWECSRRGGIQRKLTISKIWLPYHFECKSCQHWGPNLKTLAAHTHSKPTRAPSLGVHACEKKIDLDVKRLNFCGVYVELASWAFSSDMYLSALFIQWFCYK